MRILKIRIFQTYQIKKRIEKKYWVDIFPISLQTKAATYSLQIHCGEKLMADREGFEPSVLLPVHTLSRRAHSTTLTPAR